MRFVNSSSSQVSLDNGVHKETQYEEKLKKHPDCVLISHEPETKHVKWISSSTFGFEIDQHLYSLFLCFLLHGS